MVVVAFFGSTSGQRNVAITAIDTVRGRSQSSIGTLLIDKRDESKALRLTCGGVHHDLGRGERAKLGEIVAKRVLSGGGRKVSHKEFHITECYHVKRGEGRRARVRW